MEFKTCKNCAMVFQYMGSGDELCPSCCRQEERDFEKVKAYINKNPSAKAEEILEKTGVSESSILRMVKSGKLDIESVFKPTLTCSMCGLSIQSGRYCADCERKMAHGFGNGIPTAPASHTAAMRFIKRK
ncbi:MAG: hypothetical protein K6E91_07720 [Butyrivibrio sp.]|nr:hypothetical protein [Butyrivibrio sp.]